MTPFSFAHSCAVATCLLVVAGYVLSEVVGVKSGTYLYILATVFSMGATGMYVLLLNCWLEGRLHERHD